MAELEFETWADMFEDKGRRDALKTVVTKRFGAISGAVAMQIENVPPGEVGHWIERALDADSLESLLKGTAPHGE